MHRSTAHAAVVLAAIDPFDPLWLMSMFKAEL